MRRDRVNANPDKSWFFFSIEDEIEGVKTRFMSTASLPILVETSQ